MVKMKDPRIYEYRYWDQLVNHLGGDVNKLFNGEFVWPKQLEIHLAPSNGVKACPLSCSFCGGKLFDKTLGHWEMDALELLAKINGAIPSVIFGGSYTEPLGSCYFAAFLAATKKYGSHFGVHTSGINLLQLEESTGLLTEMNRISTDKEDYLSISLDAGLADSWALAKGVNHPEWFDDIISAIERAVKIRKENGGGHAIRICYLISPATDSVENFSAITKIAKEIGVHSLRFSIPFAHYNQSFDTVRKYRANREIPGDALYREGLAPYLSESMDEQPYIFYSPPWFTDVDRFTFDRCFYSYFQATLGADGFVYRCSTTATPTAGHCRLGKITSDLDEFKSMIVKNQQDPWDCKEMCFDRGLRGNRMAIEINTKAQELMEKNGQ